MRKPIIKCSWHGTKGNMWRGYDVCIGRKTYHHKSKSSAYKQFKEAYRLYMKQSNKAMRRKIRR